MATRRIDAAERGRPWGHRWVLLDGQRRLPLVPKTAERLLGAHTHVCGSARAPRQNKTRSSGQKNPHHNLLKETMKDTASAPRRSLDDASPEEWTQAAQAVLKRSGAPNQRACACPVGSCKNETASRHRLGCADYRPIVPTPDSAPLKDSGKRAEVGTGAVRERALGKGLFTHLPFFGLLAAARQMERGQVKYKDARNWEKGMPLSWFADAAARHLGQYVAGFDDEPHLDAALWNLMCLAEGRERIRLGLWPAHLDDLPKTYAGQSFIPATL